MLTIYRLTSTARLSRPYRPGCLQTAYVLIRPRRSSSGSVPVGSSLRLTLGSLSPNTRISPSRPLSVTYICPAYKSLPQLLIPTSATQGGIPLLLSSCCLVYPCSRLYGISPRLL